MKGGFYMGRGVPLGLTPAWLGPLVPAPFGVLGQGGPGGVGLGRGKKVKRGSGGLGGSKGNLISNFSMWACPFQYAGQLCNKFSMPQLCHKISMDTFSHIQI